MALNDAYVGTRFFIGRSHKKNLRFSPAYKRFFKMKNDHGWI
ncbi:MAG: hypothetical protein ACJAT2_003597 [Bacteriovoracaceae bacterium]|jgi:hypothetical protein